MKSNVIMIMDLEMSKMRNEMIFDLKRRESEISIMGDRFKNETQLERTDEKSGTEKESLECITGNRQ